MNDTVFKGKKILVAEDDDDLREIIGDVFRMHGAEVLAAENGRLALDLLRVSRVDLVVSDIRMPNGDGIEFLMGVREHAAPALPFLFLSGYSDMSPNEAIAKGAQGIFTKPFDVFDLVKCVADLMNLATD